MQKQCQRKVFMIESKNKPLKLVVTNWKMGYNNASNDKIERV